MAQMQAPLLHAQSDANSRMFVMAFDGTGNDMAQDARPNWTNVALLHEQARELQRVNPSIGTGYVAGPGTQDNRLTALIDGIRGHTFESRIEEGYSQFIAQSKKWLAENPGADISLAAVGFSRGAEQAAAFTRLVHERGIQNPEGAIYERNEAGQITGVTYTKPPLVAPGEVKQAAMLFDPVGTGAPMDYDRRLAPSVLGALQISALHEQRDQFKSTEAIEQGMSADHRFLNVWVAGAHSNIGGSYRANGLSDRSFNLAVDYLNSLSDAPVFTKRAESQDPALNVIHRSHEHQFIYTQRGYRDGVRDVIERLAPEAACRPEPGACLEREPTDDRLAASVPWRPLSITPNPQAAVATPEPAPAPFYRLMPDAEPRSSQQHVDDLFDRLTTAAQQGDAAGMRRASQDYVRLDAGREWLEEGRTRSLATSQNSPPLDNPTEVSAPVMRR
jgi:hypothetical protein